MADSPVVRTGSRVAAASRRRTLAPSVSTLFPAVMPHADSPHRTDTKVFSRLPEEYEAAIHSAAVFDVSNRTRLDMTGPDAAAFLHRFCTSQVLGLPPGSGCEAFLCNVKGRILGHVIAFTGENAVRIDTASGQADSLISHLEKYHLLEDFRLSDVTADTFSLIVCGPLASARLADAGLGVDLKGAISWTASGDLTVRRLDVLGMPTFQIDGPASSADAQWQRLTAAGIQPAGRDVWTALRIEAGFPEYGRDISSDNLAQEASRTSEAISFTKGCYLGQEPIARLHAMGHVNRQLAIVEIEPTGSFACDREIPAAATLLHPDHSDKTAGTLTSIAWSPERNRAVGLGLIRSQLATSGCCMPLEGGGTARICERRLLND